MFPVFREMNKVSERPGLGAEPVAVSAGFHLIDFSIMKGFCYLDILLSFFFFFSSQGRRRSLSFGTMPPTNKQYARPCLHGSRNLSDLI